MKKQKLSIQQTVKQNKAVRHRVRLLLHIIFFCLRGFGIVGLRFSGGEGWLIYHETGQ